MDKSLISKNIGRKINSRFLILNLFISLLSFGGCNGGKNGLSTDIIQNPENHFRRINARFR